MMLKTDYSAIGEVLYSDTLPNGLTLRVIPKPGYQKTSAVFATNYGGADTRFCCDGSELVTPAGIAHYLEHKMFDMPEGDALTEFERRGAYANAFTSSSVTAYYFTCTDRFEENLRTLLRFVSTPYFTEESVNKERGIISQEIQMEQDDPDFRLYLNFSQALFAHSPLRQSVAGTVDSIREITAQTLYDCHRVFYRPSNMALSVVGDVNPERVGAIARELLSSEFCEKPAHCYGPDESMLPFAADTEERMPVSLPQFITGVKLRTVSDGFPTTRESVLTSLTLRLLAGKSSPLFLRLYEQGLLNDALDTEAVHSAGQSFVMFGGESRDPRSVLDALQAEISAVASHGFAPDYFTRQKKAAYGASVRRLASFEDLAVSVATATLHNCNPLDNLAELTGLTAEDCRQWLLQHLIPERFATALMLPQNV